MEPLSPPDVNTTAILMALQNGTLDNATIAQYLDFMGVATMDFPELMALLASLSKSQLASVFKTLGASTDTSTGGSLIRVVWSLIAISTLVVTARLLIKWSVGRRIFYDDACMILALFFGYLHALFITKAFQSGLGRHLIFLPTQQRQHCIHFAYIAGAWGILSPMCGRIAFLISLFYVAGIDPAVKRWTILIFIGLQLLVNIGACIVFYAQCGSHMDVVWSASIWLYYQKYCWAPHVQSDYGYFSGSVNTLTDSFLTILPAIMILHSNVSRRQKLGLAFMLCLSIVALIASIVKTYESKALAQIIDYTYDLVPYVVCTSVELNIVIITASIPLLRPIFSAMINKLHHPRVQHGVAAERFPTISMGSILSKGRARSTDVQTSSSQEHIDPMGITQTVEVSVKSDPTRDVTLVHAALVGLVGDNHKTTSIWH